MPTSTVPEFRDDKKHWTLREYASLLTWFLRETMWRRKWSAAALVLVGFGAASLRVGAIIQIMAFVRAFSHGSSYKFGPFTFDTNSFIVLSVGAGSVLILASVLDYLTKLAAIKLWFEHEKRCQVQILRQLNQPGSLELEHWRDTSFSSVMRGLTRYSRYFGRLFRMSLNLPVLLCEFSVYIAMLVYLHWVLALCIFGVLMVTTRFLVWGNRVGMSASVDFDAIVKDYSTKQSHLLRGAMFTSLPDEAAEKWYADALDSQTHKSMRSCLLKRLSVVNMVSMFNETSTSVILVLVLIFFGHEAANGNVRWEAMIGFFLAARYATGAFQRLANQLTSINRFIPMVAFYRSLLEDLLAWGARAAGTAGAGGASASLALAPKAAPDLPDSADSVVWHAGRPLWLLAGSMPTPFDFFGRLNDAFEIPPDTQPRLIGDLAWVGADLTLPPLLTLRDYLLLKQDDANVLRDWVTSVQLEDDLGSVPPSLDVPMESCWQDWSEELRVTAQMLVAKHSGKQIVIFNRKACELLNNGHFERLAELFKDRFLIFETGLPHALAHAGEEADVLVLPDASFAGFGSAAWLRQNEDEIRAKLRAAAKRGGFGDEEEDEEMFM